MCFSAPVSFAASAALVVSGAVGMRIAVRKDRTFIPINLLAFCFAIQQFLEGMIWSGPSWIAASTLAKGFLFFALFVYPWFLGTTCYFLTHNPKRQRVLAGFAGVGLLYGILVYGSVLMAPHFNVNLAGAHISYRYEVLGGDLVGSSLSWSFLVPLYVILTIVPLFICDRPYAWVVGLVVLATAILSAFVYTHYFVSVWCFFATIVSLVIIFWTSKVALKE